MGQVLFFISQFAAIAILAVILLVFIRVKWLRVSILAVTGIYSGLELVSVLLTGNFIDYRFYFHMNVDSLKYFGFQYVNYYFIFAIWVVAAITITSFFATRLKKLAPNKIAVLVVALSLIGFLFLPAGVLSEKIFLTKKLGAKEVSFIEALRSLQIPPDEYVLPDQVTASKGKNIIVLNLESIEKGFLTNPAFEELTPNLRKLSRSWSYIDMPQGPGASWTAAAIFNQQAGMPAFFSGQRHELFQGTSSVKIAGLGHVLERAGYSSKHLIGNPRFAGVLDLLANYKIPVVSEENSIGKYPRVQNGFHDYDLFQEAKAQLELLTEDQAQPFALFMSTINTHAPDGIRDNRMRNYVDKGKTQLEFSIAATDFLVGDFISYLEQKNLLANTAMYILPDHLLMGFRSDIHVKLHEETRQLFLITNVEPVPARTRGAGKIYQVELPRIIIDGAGIDTNAKFLADFIEESDVNGYLERNEIKLTSLNQASQERNDFREGIRITQNEKYITISSGENTLTLPVLGRDKYTFDSTFNRDMVHIGTVLVDPVRGNGITKVDVDYFRLHLVVEMENDLVSQVYLGNKREVGLHKSGEDVSFSHEEISRIVELNKERKEVSSRFEITPEEYAADVNRFIAHAGGQIDGNKYTNSLEALNLSYKKGFRLFELDILETSDGVYVAAHDWDHWTEITGYKGPLPPTSAAFLGQEILGKYTPLDINRINQWFTDHQDATLVTDKVNTPLVFATRFTDKTRLIMKLFTWAAVTEGKAAGIRSAMPTGSLITDQRTKDIGAVLKSKGITDVAASMYITNTHVGVVKSLVRNGIRIYGFHLNGESGLGEEYIVCNRRNIFFGMYADNWSFNPSWRCTDAWVD